MSIKRRIGRYAVLQPVFGFIVVALAACSSAPPATSMPYSVYRFDELMSVNGVESFRLQSMVEIDKQLLIIRSSPSKSYLFVLSYPNHDIHFNNPIIISNTASYVKVKFDTVSTLNNGLQTAKIPIKAIYKINSRQQEKRIIAKIRQRKRILENAKQNTYGR